jgi:D-alanyl-D-alanine carboxypeptidase
MSVEDALLATIVRSANDAAVVLAEGIAGTEPEFVAAMNAKARRLGMSRTRFRNPSGLPADGQVTTARDMAVLARALIADFPHLYELFSTLDFRFGEKRFNSHNNILTGYQGADGLKTGFGCKAGYNLVAAATRNGRRLIGVVLGEKTAGLRDARMAELLDAGFAAARQGLWKEFDVHSLASVDGQGADGPINEQVLADSCLLHQGFGWSLEVAGIAQRREALRTARRVIQARRTTLKGGRPLLIPRAGGSKQTYRGLITGLKREPAIATCREMRKDQAFCIVLPPENLRVALETARRLGLMPRAR